MNATEQAALQQAAAQFGARADRIDVLAVMGEAYVAIDPQRESLRGDVAEARAAVAELIAAMDQVAEYLEAREDVIDGDYGVPAPNAEMVLLQEVRSALARVGGAP